MNNWDKTKHQQSLAISAHPKGYISILNAIETYSNGRQLALWWDKNKNIIHSPKPVVSNDATASNFD